MAIGTSLFLIALGAVLRFAVQDSIEEIDLTTVGLILMIVGAVGLVIGLWMMRRYTSGGDPVDRDPRYDRRV